MARKNPFDLAVDDAIGASSFDPSDSRSTQVQDKWGRSPGDPQYGEEPQATPRPGPEPSAPSGGSGPSPTTSPPTSSASGAKLGGGWDQYTSDPASFQSGLKTALERGLSGDAAIDWMDANGWKGAKNPAGGGIQYYPESGMFGLPGGYKVAPGAGGTLDMYRVDERGGGGRSAAPMTAMPMSAPALPGAAPDGMDAADTGDLMAGTLGALQGPGAGPDAADTSASRSMAPGEPAPDAAPSRLKQLQDEFFRRYAQPGGAQASPSASRGALLNLLNR